jgi:transcriptional regulator with XRE-family HTH domain
MKKMNIVKQVCKVLNLSQKDLAFKYDIAYSTLARWA